jgi:hypothetical protein
MLKSAGRGRIHFRRKVVREKKDVHITIISACRLTMGANETRDTISPARGRNLFRALL